jgi:hypothetical protein
MHEEVQLHRKIPSWNRVMDCAVVKTFGRDIEVVHKQDVRKELKRFQAKLEVEVCDSSPEPNNVQPCIIDVTTKEFYNHGTIEPIKTVIKNYKNSKFALGAKYHYKIKEGVRFDDFNLGWQIVTLSMTGGHRAIGDHPAGTSEQLSAYSQFRGGKDLQVYNNDFMIHYDHKETLSIPPQTKVTATITTISKRFEQDYILRFRCEKSECIQIKYLNRCQRMCSVFRNNCCGCFFRPIKRLMYAKDILQDLPSFEEDDRYCWFTLNGTLIWLGEECSVKITQISLTQ